MKVINRRDRKYLVYVIARSIKILYVSPQVQFFIQMKKVNHEKYNNNCATFVSLQRL